MDKLIACPFEKTVRLQRSHQEYNMQKGKYGTYFVDDLAEAKDSNQGALIYGNFMIDPATKGGTSNPNNLRSEFGVIALVKFCGFILGNFSNAGPIKLYQINQVQKQGNHAEDQFMAAWEEFIETSVYQEIITLQGFNNKAPYITIKLSRSPCSACTPKLIDFIKSHNIKIRMKILQLYGGEEGILTNRLSVLALISHGFAIKAWDVLNPQKGYRSKTKANLPHEMMFATMHLKNVSRDDEVDEERELTAEEEAFLDFRTYIIDSNEKLEEHLLAAHSFFSNPPDISKLNKTQRPKAKKLIKYMEIIKKEPKLYLRTLLLEQYYHSPQSAAADNDQQSAASSSPALVTSESEQDESM